MESAGLRFIGKKSVREFFLPVWAARPLYRVGMFSVWPTQMRLGSLMVS